MEEENNSWINIADIMSALMMIFMFISIAFMYQLENEKELYRIKLNTALHKEFDKDLENWKAEITVDNIFRFKSPFERGHSQIPNNFYIILDNFSPRYINLLTLPIFKSEIDEVRIEGHTSNGWGKTSTRKENYLNNMHLSQERANNVLSYLYELNSTSIEDNREWLEKHLRANGMAFSNLLYLDKKEKIEDMNNSRRVEFRVIAKEHNQINH